jgi:hypothetical protein
MTKTFEETFDQLKQCIEDDGGIFDLGWCQEFLYPFINTSLMKNLQKKLVHLLASGDYSVIGKMGVAFLFLLESKITNATILIGM